MRAALAVLLLTLAAQAATEPPARRIEDAFVRHGMPPMIARCYGRVIDDRLSRENAVAAAEIVETSEKAEDIRAGVIWAGFGMIGAFRAARDTCGR
ncbi:MAG: hypothetical protein ACFBWO_16915 [Paracoccaceae bacterium]